MNLNKLISTLLTAHIVAGWSTAQAADTLTIVRDGMPQAVIVTGPEPGKQIQGAAEELQTYIERSTGAKLPINPAVDSGVAIHVGETPYVKSHNIKPADLDEDGFIIRGADDGNLVIVGGSQLGTEFGVYEFLERFVGVRWLMPGTVGEDVPRAKTLEVPLKEIRQEPVFLSREYYKPSPGSEELWAKRNRFHARVEPGHNMLALFPVEEFGETRPDFYPLIDGKRQLPGPRIGNAKNLRERRSHRNWQPNFTAPGIVDVAVEKIDKFFQENPAAESFKLGLNDGNDNFDQSEESLKRRSGRRNSMGYMDASDDYFLWANEVVGKVLEKHPEKWFGMLAYRALTDPPTYAGVNSRLVPYMTQDRLRWADPQLKEADQNRTKNWASVAKNLGWYDYTYGNCYLAPRVYPQLMGEYLRWAADHNVRFYYSEYNPNWGEGGKAWLLMRLLWNPHQDVDALLTEWYERAGGKEAAPKLKEYYEIWEKFWTQDILKSKWWHGKGPYLSFAYTNYLRDIPQDYIDRSGHLLDEALALASTPEQKARVAGLREMWETWYKPNILLSQMSDKMGYVPQTESEALQALNDAEESILLARTYEQAVSSLRADQKHSNPFFENIASRLQVNRLPWATGYGDMGFLLWRLEPWVTKSEKIRQRLEQLKEMANPVLRDNARAILAAGEKRGVSLVKNASFEQGDESWDLEVEVVQFPSDYPFPYSKGEGDGSFAVQDKIAKTGKSSLEVSADQVSGTVSDIRTPALIGQTLPYEPGFYYAQVNYYLPQTSPRTPATRGKLKLQALDEKGDVLPEVVLPSVEVDPIAGKWGRNTTVFTLPPKANARNLRAVLELDMRTPIGDFDPSQKIYIDDLNVVKVE